MDGADPHALSIQETLFPGTMCFGCGPANAKGLRLRSYAVDADVVATFLPWPEHDNGLGFLNGGIISTVLDCHSAAVVMHEADARGWQAIGGAAIPFVTSGLDVRYLRPTPLLEPVDLHGTMLTASEDDIVAEVELHQGGKVRATAVARWSRWRPR